jgi:hypothetical protein
VSVPKKLSTQALSRSSLAYDDLAIKEGGHAASQYYRRVFVETDWVERATIEEDVSLNTEAMCLVFDEPVCGPYSIVWICRKVS